MAYIVGWLFNYYLYAMSEKRFPRKIAALFSALIIGAIVSLRGNVGTDTWMYVSFARDQPPEGIEPLFRLLLLILTWIIPNPQYAVTLGIGGVFTALLVIYAVRANRTESFILQTFYIPVFCFPNGVNVLRIGLACAFLVLAVQCYGRKEIKSALGLCICACLIQYTSIVFIAIWCMLYFKFSLRRGLLFLLSGCALLGCFLFVAPVYVDMKFAAYLDEGHMVAPSITSGLSTIGGIVLILVGFVLDDKAMQKIKVVMVTMAFTLAFFGMTIVSYAGLRLLNLLYMAVLFSIASLFQFNEFRFGKRLRACIMLAGLCGCVFTYRNFYSERETSTKPASNSSFLPYKFFWEE